MGRGGYRYGAGRPAFRPKAEHCLRLDVRQIARRDLLRPCSYSWHWTNSYTGEETGAISITASASSLALSYSASGQPVSERVSITRTPCQFGGNRPWFQCPRCQGRVAVLYLRGGRFVCRACARVTYASQCEDVVGRSWRRQRKLEALLGENWARPKGMHHATRKRILNTIIECEDLRDRALDDYLVRMGVQLGRTGLWADL
jgi:hypothetical protein